MYVRIYVCMYVCVYVFMFVCVYVCMYVLRSMYFLKMMDLPQDILLNGRLAIDFRRKTSSKTDFLFMSSITVQYAREWQKQ